jgi:hypothetical protein
MDDDCGFVIFSGNKLWYSSKENVESAAKQKPIKNTSKVRNSAKNKRVVHHQIFEEIMKLETDPYWISFFDDAATNNLPRNFRFINNCLTYHVRSKNIDLMVPEDPMVATSVIKRFLMENAGIISQKDLKEKRIEEEKFVTSIVDIETLSWSQIRSEKQQDIIVSLFVEKIGEYYKLGMNERKALMQNIKIGILAGYFNNDNIKLSGNQISHIHGLEYDEDSRKFCINYDVCKPKASKRIYQDDNTVETSGNLDDEININSKKSLLKQWNRYLSDMYKKAKI